MFRTFRRYLLKRKCLFGLVLLSIFSFFSCENEIEKVQALTSYEAFPDLHLQGAVINYTDSAVLRVQVQAPVIKNYNLPVKPYTEFPVGVYIQFFEQSGEKSADLRADYAIQYEDQALWEARGDVVINNDKGEMLNTEILFWDQNQGRIYSNEFTKITSEDGVYYGQDGFESDESFSRWKLKGSSGEVNIKEEE